MEKYSSPDSMQSFALHGDGHSHPEYAHLMPIFATSTFTFESAEQGTARFSGEEPGFVYSRFGNPTLSAAEEMLAGMEGFGLSDEKGKPLQLHARLHASGQGALATLLLSVLRPGDTVLSHSSVYGGTFEMIFQFLPNFGINAIATDFDDADKLKQLIATTKNVKLIHLETPANPLLSCIDLEVVCAIAAEHGIKVSVDNTFATPYLQQPFRFGADFVFHSTTKFLNGHGNAIGGVLIGKDANWMKQQAYQAYKLLGACPSAFDAFLVMNGAKTLPLRMEKHCENAEKVAAFLADHPKVEKVHYNGLSSHPGYAITQKQMRRPGAVLSFELDGGMTAAINFINRLQLCTRAVSLGTVDTLLSHPASMSHSGVSKADREKAGITDGLIRMSVGLECVEDIINDLQQALG
ncbi:aminotransferase class I/II-fold pyridoxal phosphate-dependent enzyme [Danxiaibacter flavus]|uniref:Aminotransferase class I/II-fold pyridoxal phosphate-dependent enzyme n=1 Tax=Danxiaibacter flavus TaxID=3049108 RepID=A0ABV3ZLT5_9BACT|nr:aminotransferase class I/II-fold pyridoxal phosphate-dependent enzyme [Chitinophagaceae bacterium DXS]